MAQETATPTAMRDRAPRTMRRMSPGSASKFGSISGSERGSRPPADIGRVFGSKPVAVIGASPGGFGAILAQNAWMPVLRTLGTAPWFGGRQLSLLYDAK